ncbi:MAG: hypothetical protein E7091_06570 [Bacteroidales bacterium]|nr:hypothetical protein [Bacteroidales bacterium]
MKRHYSLLSILAVGAALIACNKENAIETPVNDIMQETSANTHTRGFAEPDGANPLKGTPSENLKAIFEATGPGIITSLGEMNITEEQYKELKEFTDKLVANNNTQMEKYRTIFRWVSTNLTFNDFSNPDWYHMGNDPYEVFKNRVAVCQGYSNLLTVMCFSQGIPTVVVNGFLDTGYYELGHAWVYTCPDNTWIVSDPTNKGSYEMKNTSTYKHLRPMQADVELYWDGSIVYNYANYSINIKEIHTGSASLSIPYSTLGFVISSFNPTMGIPEDISEIYIGRNITTFGESYNMGLSYHGTHLQAIHVDENNPTLMGHKGIVYKRNGDDPQLYYIPGGMSFIELLPMELVDKNTIYNHTSVEEIYFPEGTKRLESYAIENCPKLKRIYVPVNATIANNALYNVPKNVDIIRGVPSGITNITMD